MTRSAQFTFTLLLVGSLLVACCGDYNSNVGATVTADEAGFTPAARPEQLPSATRTTGPFGLETGTEQPTATALDTGDLCVWRKCEVEQGPLSCDGTDQVCDMFRNRCIQACTGGDCCVDVSCPQGAACAPAVGRCGVPVGQGCFDMGTTWWTGRDIPPGQRRGPESPLPAIFEVHNDSRSPLYFESTQRQTIRFELFQQWCNREQKLELPENHFCPSPCPDQGPARDLDCRKPPRAAQRLPAGKTVNFTWSGTEEVGMRRICDRPQGQFCMVNRVTLPGTYTVEVCAHTVVDGGQPDPNDPNRLIMATLTGERQCLRVEFRHPTTTPVVIRFGG